MLGKKLKPYVNVFLIGLVFELAVGILVLVKGYGLSLYLGFYPIDDRSAEFISCLRSATFWLGLDIVYVELKRRYKLNGKSRG